MLKFYEVEAHIKALKNTLPKDERYSVLSYLVAMAEAEARDLGKILAREARQAGRSDRRQASGV